MIPIKTSHLIHVKFFRSLAIKRRRFIMNCVEYENVGIAEFTRENKAEGQRVRLRAVPVGRARLGDQVARRVAEVLDDQLAHGAMPA
jgi:hypothetical protein